MDELRAFLFSTPTPGAHPLSCNALTLSLALFYFLAFHATYLTRATEPKGKGKFVEHHRAEWHNSLGSAFNAALVVALLVPALPEIRSYSPAGCYFGYGMWQDFSGRSFAAFLVHDVFNMLMYYPLNDSKTQLMLVHHFLFLTVASYCVQGSYFRFPAFWLMAGELSNIFLNAKILMAAAGYKGSLYTLNGLVFVVVFGSIRVVIYGLGLRHFWQTRYVWLSDSAPWAFVPMIALITLGYGLQLYWFALSLKMLVRRVQKVEKNLKQR